FTSLAADPSRTDERCKSLTGLGTHTGLGIRAQPRARRIDDAFPRFLRRCSAILRFLRDGEIPCQPPDSEDHRKQDQSGTHADSDTILQALLVGDRLRL